MNPTSKLNIDKINKYRQKIKQQIIQQTGQIGSTGYSEVKYKPQADQVKKIPSSLSRSNIFKNPADVLSYSRNNEQGEDDRSMTERSRIEQNKQNKLMSQSRMFVLDQSKQQQRTAQKSTSKSPLKSNPYLNEEQMMTKRKSSNRPIQKPTLSKSTVSNNTSVTPTFIDHSPSFHHLSSFETFCQKSSNNLTSHQPSNNVVLPSLFPPISSTLPNYSEQQVKVLLEQNQILTIHLNQKMQRIKSLEREMKAAVKSQILHGQKYDIEVSQLISENQTIKKSTDEQINTLVMEVKKLNDQLFEKQQDWQQRLNLIRKQNIQEQQQQKKAQLVQEQSYKTQISELQIIISAKDEQLKTTKVQLEALISTLHQQNLNISEQMQKLTHAHRIQISQLTISSTNSIRQTKQQYLRKMQAMNVERRGKEHELNRIIQQLNTQIRKLTFKIDEISHQKDFTQVKEMQARGKIAIQMKEEKQKNDKIRQQQNTKLKQLSKAQFQTMKSAYESQISELTQNILSLQKLMKARQQQIQSLYKEIHETRSSYQKELQQKQSHISNLTLKLSEEIAKNMQQQECLKIKLAQLTQANQLSLQELYEKQIQELKKLALEKESIIVSLRDKLKNQSLRADELRAQHAREIKNYQVRIQKFEQEKSFSALKEKNISQSNSQQSQVLKQNLVKQSLSYEKTLQVSQQNIKRLQSIILTKDTEIEQLTKRLQILKKSHKEQVQLLKQQNILIVSESNQAIAKLKQQLDYAKKQQQKKQQQFIYDKQYYSNQLREVKNKGQTEFNTWVDKLSSELNHLKAQNEDLKQKLSELSKEYTEYKKLWNQSQTGNKLQQAEKAFAEQLSISFSQKYQQLVHKHEDEIQRNYQVKIDNLTEMIKEKEEQILDMKSNYHLLEVKFQRLIEEKQTLNDLNQKILTLGKDASNIGQNYLKLTN